MSESSPKGILKFRKRPSCPWQLSFSEGSCTCVIFNFELGNCTPIHPCSWSRQGTEILPRGVHKGSMFSDEPHTIWRGRVERSSLQSLRPNASGPQWARVTHPGRHKHCQFGEDTRYSEARAVSSRCGGARHFPPDFHRLTKVHQGTHSQF